MGNGNSADEIVPKPQPQPQNYKYFAILDFEATCEKREKDPNFGPREIIEFPIVFLNAETLEIDFEFRRFVTPEENPQLTEFCTGLTKITQDDVSRKNGAAPFREIWIEVIRFLVNHRMGEPQKVLFVTDGDWDLKTMLPDQVVLSGWKVEDHIPLMFKTWANVKELYSTVYEKPVPDGQHPPSLETMLKGLKMEFEGHLHSGLADSRNIARIVKRLISDGCVLTPTSSNLAATS